MVEELGTTTSRDLEALNGSHAAVLIAAVLVTYWASVAFDGLLPVASVLQPLTGSILVLFLPGALLVGLLEIDAGTPGRFVLYAVGSSVAILTLTMTAAALALASRGLELPISVGPTAGAASLLVVGMAALVPLRATAFPYPDVEVRWLPAVTGLLVLLPIVSIGAAVAMNRWEANLGMYLFVGLVVLVVALSATRYVPESLYPPTVFAVSLSVLLHRNLLTDHVIGADVQFLYAAARHVAEVGSWSPEMVGVSAAIPVVTAVPAAVSTVTGLGVAMTFKLLYVFVFALVPLGVYYVARDVFDPDVALFGALFFQFYHISFIFTPGKQLVSELFVVLLLSTLPSDLTAWKRGLLVALFSVGLVHTHYAMAYLFGLALLVASVGLAIGGRRFGRFGPKLPISYPVLLLSGATVWYALVSRPLAESIASIPLSMIDQVTELILHGTVPGSGASFVTRQTTPVDTAQLGVYVLLTLLLVIGLGWRTASHLASLRAGTEPDRVGYTLLALPLFAFLGASYVFVFDLWADRAYQLALTVLAPFAAYGFGRMVRRAATLPARRSPSLGGPRWLLLAILLGSLFAFNSSAVAALAGTTQSATFDAEAHDLAFSDEERSGVHWLLGQPDIHRTEPASPSLGARNTVDAPRRVQIYTDQVSAQLFRALLPEQFYDVEIVELKNEWQPSLDRSRIDEGYVYLRRASVTSAPEEGRVPTSHLSRREVDELEAAGEVVYANEDVVILKVPERETS